MGRRSKGHSDRYGQYTRERQDIEKILSVAPLTVMVKDDTDDPTIRHVGDVIVHTLGLIRLGLPDIVFVLGSDNSYTRHDKRKYLRLTEQLSVNLFQSGIQIAEERPEHIVSNDNAGTAVLFERFAVVTELDMDWVSRLRATSLSTLDEHYSGFDYGLVIYKQRNIFS